MQRKNFNKNWMLRHGLTTFMESIFGNPARAEQVDLPNDVMITLGRDAKEITGAGMGYFKYENVEYTKTFFVSEKERGRVHYLNFDGVYMNATILVNGLYVERHESGYAPCTLRIDKFLKYGCENTVTVMIRGTAQPNARWYSGLGIYRNVWILSGERLHIANDSLHLTTKECDEELAVIAVEAEIKNDNAEAKRACAKFCIKSSNGEIVSTSQVQFYVEANGKIVIQKRMQIEHPMLWDVDAPTLYTCECEIVEDSEQVVDKEESRFGIRMLRLDSVHGLRINGKSVKLRGGCVHHDNGVIGAVSFKDTEVRKIRLLKEAGYNAVRTAHNPPSVEFLDACDEVGMLVMHEFTDVWTDVKAIYDYGQYMPKCWESDLENTVNRDYNHPSIVMWSIGNEIPETGNAVSAQWGRKMVDKLRKLDSSRYITNGMNVMVSVMPRLSEVINEMILENGGSPEEANVTGGVNEIMDTHPELMAKLGAGTFLDQYVKESCDMLDIVGYNYTTNRYEREHEMYPNWVFVGTETNSPELDANWEIVERCPYVIGDFSWTAWDYLGEVGCGRLVEKARNERASMAPYPWLTANCADFDITGYRRPMSYWRETVWNGRNHEPYIAVWRPQNYGMEYAPNNHAWTDSVHSWTWPGQEGKTTAVEVYSDAEEVELFVNQISVGRKTVGTEFKKFYCKWETVYEPGEIMAIAYIGGLKVGKSCIKTAEEPHLEVRMDKTRMQAGKDEVCHVEIELRDENQTLDMGTKKRVKLSAEGPVSVIGYGSAAPCLEESFQADCQWTFEGRLMAVLKAGNESGTAKIRISAGGMKPVEVNLEMVKYLSEVSDSEQIIRATRN